MQLDDVGPRRVGPHEDAEHDVDVLAEQRQQTDETVDRVPDGVGEPEDRNNVVLEPTGALGQRFAHRRWARGYQDCATGLGVLQDVLLLGPGHDADLGAGDRFHALQQVVHDRTPADREHLL